MLAGEGGCTPGGDVTRAAVRDGGGTVRTEPMDVMGEGMLAQFTDPQGAEFACWQPGHTAGIEVASVENSLVWSELHVPDPIADIAFYAELFGWRYADPVIAVAIGVFVLPRAFSLGRHAVRILLQHAPSGIDVTAVAKSLTDVEDVEEVHDLHIWTLTSGMEVASAHLTVAPGVESPRVLAAAQQVLLERYGLEHATLQVEPPQGEGRCREMTW